MTAAGQKQLVRETNRWRQMTRAIGLVMGEETQGEGDDELAQVLWRRQAEPNANLIDEIESIWMKKLPRTYCTEWY